jgi:hypothetical protein
MLSSMKKMEQLLNKLCKSGYIRSEQVYKAMLQVDRGDFINSDYAYDDW